MSKQKTEFNESLETITEIMQKYVGLCATLKSERKALKIQLEEKNDTIRTIRRGLNTSDENNGKIQFTQLLTTQELLEEVSMRPSALDKDRKKYFSHTHSENIYGVKTLRLHWHWGCACQHDLCGCCYESRLEVTKTGVPGIYAATRTDSINNC